MADQAVRRALVVVTVLTIGLLSVPLVRARADVRALPRGAMADCGGEHWVGAWLGAPQGSSVGEPHDADGPPRTFSDQTLRMVVSPLTGGSALRVRLSNRFGPEAVELDDVAVGARTDGAALEPGSGEPLTFDGARSVVVPAGGEVVSDPLGRTVRAFEDLAVSFHVAGDAVLDQHQWATSTQYATPTGSGNHVGDEGGAVFTEQLQTWIGVSAVDVLTSRRVGAVVTLGDSITDGVGSSLDANRRWPDALARRLAGSGAPLSVVNAGIGGNHVVTSGLVSDRATGPSAQERLDLDVLRVAGATDLLVFEGVNDIFNADPSADIAAAVIAGHQSIIDRARDAELRVIGATITPAAFVGIQEAARLAINEWIRTSGAYDAVVDFDVVARDPGMPSRVRPEWDAFFAHLNDDGYAALADAVPLDVFQGASC